MGIAVPLMIEVPARSVRRPRTPQPRARIAVRHTENLSGSDADDVARALTILLADILAARPSIHVASRMAGAAPARRRPHVDYVVDSTLLRSGNQLQVLVQLAEAAAGVRVLTRTVTGQTGTIRHLLAAIAWMVARDIEGAFDRCPGLTVEARAG